MDGLEIYETTFSHLKKIIDYRIEAEYFNSKFIKNDNLLDKFSTMVFNKFARIQNGRAYSSEKFSRDADIFIAKIGDVTNKRTVPNWEKLKREEFIAQSGELLSDNDILMSLTGDPPDVGKVSLIMKHGEECTWNQRVAKISLVPNNYISNFVLYAVLSSEISRLQMERFAKGIRQRNLGSDCFEYVRLPILTLSLQNVIHNIVYDSQMCLQNADRSYRYAEELLDNYLGSCEFADENCAVKALSNIMQSGRLDAEYYQPKYDELFDILRKFATANLGGANGLVSIKKSIEPGSDAYRDEGVPFVRVSDVNKFELVDPAIRISPTIVPNIENLYPCKDTILLSKDGSVGIAYKLEEDRQIVTSGALLHLTIKDTGKILPDYLTLVLNSPIVQLQAERDCNGAIIQHWAISDIEKVVIPVLDMEKQKEITDKVQESFHLRKEAKSLLDRAIKAVEMAIEIGETTALYWLKWQN